MKERKNRQAGPGAGVRLLGVDSVDTRTCDLEARRLLGPSRASSIFSPPCRTALEAGTYILACELNEKALGKRLSQQCFHIVAKMAVFPT